MHRANKTIYMNIFFSNSTHSLVALLFIITSCISTGASKGQESFTVNQETSKANLDTTPLTYANVLDHQKSASEGIPFRVEASLSNRIFDENAVLDLCCYMLGSDESYSEGIYGKLYLLLQEKDSELTKKFIPLLMDFPETERKQVCHELCTQLFDESSWYEIPHDHPKPLKEFCVAFPFLCDPRFLSSNDLMECYRSYLYGLEHFYD